MSVKKEVATKYHGSLPHFIYKNDEIYYVPIYPIKIVSNKKVTYQKESLVEIKNFELKTSYRGYNIYFKLKNENFNKNGLKVYIEISNHYNISHLDKQMIVKVIEGIILKIMQEHIDENIDLNDLTEYNNNKNYSNNYQEEESSNDDEYDEQYYQNNVVYNNSSFKGNTGYDYDDNNYDKFDNF